MPLNLKKNSSVSSVRQLQQELRGQKRAREPTAQAPEVIEASQTKNEAQFEKLQNERWTARAAQIAKEEGKKGYEASVKTFNAQLSKRPDYNDMLNIAPG